MRTRIRIWNNRQSYGFGQQLEKRTSLFMQYTPLTMHELNCVAAAVSAARSVARLPSLPAVAGE